MTQRQVAEAARTLREFVIAMMRTAPASDLSRTAAGTLSVLQLDGPQRITALADREAITQPAMTGLIQRLETGGLVVRQADPVDGRACLIAITREGREALERRRLQHDEVIASRIAKLSPKQLSLLRAALPAISTLSENS
ncbi:MAG: MarR family transcriptional regulator [Aeromicrobium sp.]